MDKKYTPTNADKILLLIGRRKKMDGYFRGITVAEIQAELDMSLNQVNDAIKIALENCWIEKRMLLDPLPNHH